MIHHIAALLDCGTENPIHVLRHMAWCCHGNDLESITIYKVVLKPSETCYTQQGTHPVSPTSLRFHYLTADQFTRRRACSPQVWLILHRAPWGTHSNTQTHRHTDRQTYRYPNSLSRCIAPGYKVLCTIQTVRLNYVYMEIDNRPSFNRTEIYIVAVEVGAWTWLTSNKQITFVLIRRDSLKFCYYK